MSDVDVHELLGLRRDCPVIYVGIDAATNCPTFAVLTDSAGETLTSEKQVALLRETAAYLASRADAIETGDDDDDELL